MLSLIPVQAAFGDCLLLKYGEDPKPSFILIDGGPPATYAAHLQKALAHFLGVGGRLERVVLSHVDNDHIIGLIDLFAELKRQRADGDPTTVIIGGLWHNSFSNTIDTQGHDILGQIKTMLVQSANAMSAMDHAGMALLGIGEGERLQADALVLKIARNQDIGDPIIVGNGPGGVAFGTLKLTVVGPTRRNLKALEQEWDKWVKKHERGIRAGDPKVMANADRSVPNLSSICLVAEADGKRMLLTGDGRSDHLMEGLEETGFLDAQGEAYFDLLKLAHHGSDRNVTRAFFQRIRADKYVVSADGTYDNPDLATLTWLVEEANEQGRAIEIIATNDTDSTRKFVLAYPPSDYNYTLTIMPANKSWMEVRL